MSPNAEGVCWSCGAKLLANDYQRESECPQCRKQTHVCRNCRFYEPGRPHDCQEPIAEPVGNKLRANFCDYYVPRGESQGRRRINRTKEAKAALEALFKKK